MDYSNDEVKEISRSTRGDYEYIFFDDSSVVVKCHGVWGDGFQAQPEQVKEIVDGLYRAKLLSLKYARAAESLVLEAE